MFNEKYGHKLRELIFLTKQQGLKGLIHAIYLFTETGFEINGSPLHSSHTSKIFGRLVNLTSNLSTCLLKYSQQQNIKIGLMMMMKIVFDSISGNIISLQI